MAKDPVCGMYVKEETAKYRKKMNGEMYYFCSSRCLNTFERPEKELRSLKILAAVGIALSIPTLLLSFLIDISHEEIVLFAIATSVQFGVGWRFYKGAYEAARSLSANMDTLIVLGTTAAWLYSTLVTFVPTVFKGDVFFDASVLIVTFIMVGKFLEEVSKGRASESLRKLLDLQPRKTVVVRGGKELEVPIEEIKEGDMFIVKPGEKVATDGVIIEGSSSIDESMITGESIPLGKKPGDEVIGATINKSGLLKIRATKVGKDTTLSQIISLVSKAQTSRIPVQRLADKVSSIFVPSVVIVSVIVFVLWFLSGQGMIFSLSISIAILIIACPCALGLATPIAIMMGTSKAAESGILIRSGEALETSRKIDTVVFDKTGTLTKGEPSVTNIVALRGLNQSEVLRLGAIAEKGSEHPIGKAIVRKANQKRMRIPKTKNYQTSAGRGIVTNYLGGKLVVGNRGFLNRHGVDSGLYEKEIKKLEDDGKTVVIVSFRKSKIGLIAIADTLQEHSKKAVSALRQRNKEVVMVTGDNESTARAIASQLGIKRVLSQVLPADKAGKIKDLQKEGRIVAMVGDGINDAPALAQADIGIAIGSGTDVAKETGSIVLIKHDLRDVVIAMDISKYTMKKVKQNLFWAFAYNVAGIPIAAGILFPFFGFLLTPVFAGGAMAFSSFFVVMNSVLMRSYRPKIAIR